MWIRTRPYMSSFTIEASLSTCPRRTKGRMQEEERRRPLARLRTSDLGKPTPNPLRSSWFSSILFLGRRKEESLGFASNLIIVIARRPAMSFTGAPFLSFINSSLSPLACNFPRSGAPLLPNLSRVPSLWTFLTSVEYLRSSLTLQEGEGVSEPAT